MITAGTIISQLQLFWLAQISPHKLPVAVPHKVQAGGGVCSEELETARCASQPQQAGVTFHRRRT